MAIHVKFTSNKIILSGLWQPNSPESAAIICHPHPLFGGDMHNPVVVAAANAYAAKGISTLQFNFRGVGDSGGGFDNGKGEQRDVLAAISWLKKQGITQIHLCGYSFGAWINALVVSNGITVTDMVMIAPPVASIKFPTVLNLPPLSLAITGANDDIAPPDMILSLLTSWNPKAKLEIISCSDHFLFNALTDLQTVIGKHLAIA